LFSLLRRLEFRVTLIFLLISLVPLGIVSLYSVRMANRVILEIVGNQLENVAAEKQKLLQRWLAERQADLEVVAGSVVLRSMDRSEIARHLQLVGDRYKVYRRFLVLDASGKLVYDTRSGEDRSAADAQGHERAMRGETFLSEVTLAPDGSESVFRLATPIPGSDGKPQGSVCATVSTREISVQVLNVSLGVTGECYLVDRTGRFLAHKDPQRILRENIAQSGSFANLFGEERQPIYTDYRGIAVLGASRPVEGTPWYLVAEQDRDEAFASSDQLARNHFLVIALTVAGAIGLSWFSGWYVTSPVRRLSAAAEALSRGEFTHPLPDAPLHHGDEMDSLYAAFRHMAQQLYERHARLEQRIGVTEEELRRSDQRLQETLQAAFRSQHLASLGRLAAGVAHEIRTPLTSLKLFLQGVQEELSTSPELAKDHHIALEQVRRIEATVNQFLDFARPREPFRTVLDFARLVDEALSVVGPRAKQQGVQIETRIESGLPRVEGDMRQLSEALVNLAANAIDAMPQGGRVRVTVAAQSAAGHLPAGVCIDVADTGPGIPKEDLQRLFEPFFSTKPSGAGLGLAMVHSTVQRHGGEVRVDTALGRGTTFRILLSGTNPDAK